jgi:hypothetical protein
VTVKIVRIGLDSEKIEFKTPKEPEIGSEPNGTCGFKRSRVLAGRCLRRLELSTVD